MTTRVHMHFHVANLEASRAFYERFFGVSPVKERAGYLKFLPEFAPVNLALSPGAADQARSAPVNHVGIQVDSTEEVLAHLARVQASGLPVRTEMGVDCCHANQDKFWVKDPDGLEWEVYHLNYDLPEGPTRPVARKRALPMAMAENACCAGPNACSSEA